MPVSAPRSPGWLHLAGLALLVWGAALATVHRFGSDMPNWDQWDAEGKLLYLPYAQGTLEWRAFFAPHNEHRIALTRALALSLFLANGQWDARLECVVSALLHVAIAILAMAWSWRNLAARWRWPALILITVLAATPIAWENVLGGFHSQWYFLIGLSLGAIGGLVTSPPGSRAWWAAVGCAFAALFSMASGLLAAVTAGAVVSLVTRSRTDWKRNGGTLAVCALVAALGWWLLHFDAGSEAARARSVREFLAAFQHNVGWAFEGFGWWRRPRMIVLPVLSWLPWLGLGVRLLRQGRRTPPAELALFAVGLWVLLQLTASAYARGLGAPWIPNRYLDMVVVGIVTNALALAWIASRPATNPLGQRLLLVAATLGLLATLTGSGINATRILRVDLPQQREHLVRGEIATRTYLQTNDAAFLLPDDIPYPDVEAFIERLSHPEIRAILPVSLQPAPGHMGPLSRVALALTRLGGLIAGLGAAVLVIAAVRDWRSVRDTAGDPATRARRA